MAAPASRAYRIRTQKNFFTWSQAPNLTKDIIEAHIKECSPPFKEYLIARETHQDGTPHFHMVAAYHGRVDIKNAQEKFTIGGYKPNIKPVTSAQHWNHLVDTYLNKEDDNPVGNAVSRDYVALAKKRKLSEALGAFAAEHPKEFVINYERIKKNLALIGKIVHKPDIKPYDSFNPSQGLLNALANNHAIVLQGGTGLGKTQFAMAWAERFHSDDWAIIRDIEKLKFLSKNGSLPKVLIFDDMGFTQWPEQCQIHLLDHEVASSIRVRYTNVEIPPRTIKIFTANPSRHPFTMDPDGAIQRRYKTVKIQGSLY